MHHHPLPARTRLAIMLVSVLPMAAAVHADTKRAIAGGSVQSANALNARWRYGWSITPPADVELLNGAFVPMIFTANAANIDQKIDAILGYAPTYDVRTVLGFNEPERADQANMTVQTAVEVWSVMTQRFADTGIKLVSPAVSDDAAGQQWLAAFMAQVDQRNADADPTNDLRVDEIAFHWYGSINLADPGASAAGFLNRVDEYHSLYGRPVRVTEFAGLDFDEDDITSEDLINANAAFLAAAVAGLESRSHVSGYAWWQFGQPDHGEQNDSALFADAGGVLAPTVIGDAYIPTLGSGDVADLKGKGRGKDYFYLRGGQITNSGPALFNKAVGFIFALAQHDGTPATSTLSGEADWGMSEGSWVRVAENATLRKAGPNLIQWRNLSIVNDGRIRLVGTSGDASNPSNTGTLWIYGDDTAASGTGDVRLDPGSTLRLGRDTDSGGFTLPYAFDLRGGTLAVTGPGVQLTGVMTVHARTDFDIADGADLTIHGSITKPAGDGSGIDKEGQGRLILLGDHTYLGSTRVNAGTLAGNASAPASPLFILSEATVAPGSSIGSMTFARATISGRLEIEIDAEAIDRLDVAGNLDLTQASLDLIALGPVTGERLVFLTFGGQRTGAFANVSGLPTGYVLDFATPQQVALVRQVPEPASAATLAALLLGLARRGRDR